jgi:hypothetical protein
MYSDENLPSDADRRSRREKAAQLVFYAGFFFMPILWAINAATFVPKRPLFQSSVHITSPICNTYGKYSMWAATISAVLFTIWLIILWSNPKSVFGDHDSPWWAVSGAPDQFATL